ncbi:unnamed protein product [Darwinula stevensoni]|uniref:CUB domain-containing protein n=1 Tax=Darwinula stevensoni TaxID=69355 RepID=A0A7R8WXJ7_9CRUS|nr:unnamed protein product [Darwinula stevensoni]CAG0878577.1 unnamed protein product [Darwinula stevensoni]
MEFSVPYNTSSWTRKDTPAVRRKVDALAFPYDAFVGCRVGRRAITVMRCQVEILPILVFLAMVLFSAAGGRRECVYEYGSGESKGGNFSSPSWPLFYPSGLECLYHFSASNREGISIQFTHFDLEPPYEAGCLNDYVDISTFSDVGFKSFIGRYCGSNLPPEILVIHPKVELYFSTNLVLQHRGFTGVYSFLPEEGIPAPGSRWEGVKGCGGVITGVGGVLASPGYPSFYPGPVDCFWLIRVPTDRHIFLQVLDLELEGSIASCSRAEVSVYDGYGSIELNQKLRKFCGGLGYYKNPGEKILLSSRNRILVRMQTESRSQQGRREDVGFRIVWTQVQLLVPGSFLSSFLFLSSLSPWTPMESDAAGNCTGGFVCKESAYCVGEEYASNLNPCEEPRHFCIHSSLQCNGELNCSDGDSSDEHDCYRNSLIAAGVVTPCALVLLAVIAILCKRSKCQGEKKKKKGTMMTFDLESTAPTTPTSLSVQLPVVELDRSPSYLNQKSFQSSFEQMSSLPKGIMTCPRHGHGQLVDLDLVDAGEADDGSDVTIPTPPPSIHAAAMCPSSSKHIKFSSSTTKDRDNVNVTDMIKTPDMEFIVRNNPYAELTSPLLEGTERSHSGSGVTGNRCPRCDKPRRQGSTSSPKCCRKRQESFNSTL